MHTNDEKKIRAAILEAFPEFEGATMEFNHRGWTSVIVDIDGAYICKFPRNEEKYEHLKKERKLIELLQEQMDDYEFPERTHINANIPFFIHKKLQGEHFPLEAYQNATKEQQDTFKESFVDFLTKLHELPPDKFQEFVPVKDEILPDYSELDPILEQDFSEEESAEAKNLLRAFNNAAKDRRQVVGHYDMHGYNFVVDPVTKKITGFFDFDEFAIGSPEFDLREVPLHYGENVGSEIIDLYNQKAKHPVDLNDLQRVHYGWSIFEYVRTKKRLDGDLKDVDKIDMNEYQEEIKQLLKNAKMRQ